MDVKTLCNKSLLEDPHGGFKFTFLNRNNNDNRNVQS